MAARLLLVDDDDALRKVLSFKLKKQGFDVVSVASGDEAYGKIKNGKFDLLISDMRMPGLSGIELLEKAKTLNPDLEVILMTAFAEVSDAVLAVKLGAFDYLTKPFDDDQLFVTVDKALKFRRLEDENRSLKKQLNGQKKEAEPVGVSKAFKEIIALVEKIAPSDATALITGPSGSGKEVIARLIHRRSGRKNGPFVAVNCAAIPKDLIESELFGHVRGAFTGAIKNKKGKFELAIGGTILLDEISELGIELQAKLLRAIQERQVEPVGAEISIDIDIRLIAASNVNLKERVENGRFRDDLFYRLNVIPVRIPSLAERSDDIPALVKTFLRKFSGNKDIQVEPSLLKALKEYPWPGNIRELENLIERMIVLGDADRLSIDDLPSEYIGVETKNKVDTFETAGTISLVEAEKQLVIQALEKTAWNRSKAAKLLKVPRHILIYRMKKYSIVVPEIGS